MAKILLVDDNEYYRSALKGILRLANYEISEVANGSDARGVLGKQEFDLVISDIRMPELDGVQLLQWIKLNFRTPVILMTAFSEILECQKAAELGADDFLLKPFKVEEIETSINRILHHKGSDADINMDEYYCKIPLDDFITGSKINFNLYLRVSSTKYLKIAYQGEDLDVQRIRGYTKRGIKYLYLTKEDFAKYVHFNIALSKKISSSEEIPLEKKRTFLKYTAGLFMEKIFVAGVEERDFEAAKDFVNTTLDVFLLNDENFILLDALNSHADYLYAHSLGVSLYGTLVAQELGWRSSPVLFRVALCGLLHDIGLKEISRTILDKPRLKMSHEERSEYETHTKRSLEILNHVKGIQEDIILVAYQHHEDCSGLGYPQKLSKSRIHPVARLINVVDTFCEFAIQGPERRKVTAQEAIRNMMKIGEKSFDPEMFPALKRLFKFDGKSAVQ